MVTVSQSTTKIESETRSSFDLVGFTIVPGGTEVREGKTPSREESICRIDSYRVSSDQLGSVTLGYERWRTGEQSLRLMEADKASTPISRLVRGCRLEVRKHESESLAILRQARLKEDGWSNLFAADLNDLDEGAGICVAEALLTLGAITVGTKAEVIGATDRQRNLLSVLFPSHLVEVPIAAYLLTRVLPILNGIGV